MPEQGRLMRGLVKNWFLVGLVAAIVFAWLIPAIGQRGGPLYPEVTIKYIAVALIFFNSGITLRTDELKSAITSFKLHLLIQGFSMGVFPFAMLFLVTIMRAFTSTNDLLLTGLIVVGCMPPPVSSAVILTKAVGGNEAGAIFNSAGGSLLGIVVTPLLLLFFAGINSDAPLTSIFVSLTSTVLLPLVFGQVVRHFYWNTYIKSKNIPFSEIGSFVLLMIIYSTFCDTFAGELLVSGGDVFIVMFVVVGIQLTAMLSVFVLSQIFNFSPKDAVCTLFCATHKSLTLGIPMLKIVFSGHPGLSLISLPLLVYHPTQILLGGLLVPGIRTWMEHADARNSKPPEAPIALALFELSEYVKLKLDRDH